MAEYISKEVAIEKTEAFCDVFVTKWTDEKVLAWIRNLPAADVVEVKRGRWVMTLYATTSKRGRVISNKKFACSECGYSNGRKQSNFCPNCGAKMDLEV